MRYLRRADVIGREEEGDEVEETVNEREIIIEAKQS